MKPPLSNSVPIEQHSKWDFKKEIKETRSRRAIVNERMNRTNNSKHMRTAHDK